MPNIIIYATCSDIMITSVCIMYDHILSGLRFQIVSIPGFDSKPSFSCLNDLSILKLYSLASKLHLFFVAIR